jgi:hypothetical protein
VIAGLLVGVAAADPTPVPSPSDSVRYVDPQTVSPGLIGLLIFLLLFGATFLLWLSMNKQLKKIDIKDDESPQEQIPAVPTGADGSARESD